MSTSWSSGVELCLRWRRQRLPWKVWVPMATILSVGSMLGDAAFSWKILSMRALVAWLVLGGLRLLDDLQDIAHDRLHHPDRVLTQTTNHKAAWVALFGALLLSLALLVPANGAPAFLLGLLGLAGVFYLFRMHTRWAGSWLRLLKYPALLLALAGHINLPIGLASALVYLGVCFDELPQEPGSRQRLKGLFIAMFFLCALSWCALWWGPLWRNIAMGAVSCVMMVAMTLEGSQHAKGRWSHFFREFMLMNVLVLLLLPQTNHL